MKRILSLFVMFAVVSTLGAQQPPRPAGGRTPVQPGSRAVTKAAPINFREAAAREALNPPRQSGEIEEIGAPLPPPPLRKGIPIQGEGSSKIVPQSTPPSATGPSPGPVKSFKAEFLTATSIPPDTMGAVGTAFIVSVTNDRMRIQTRDGGELARVTLTSFWAGVTIKGAAVSAFDPKVFYDRFNNRFILVSSANGQSVNSGALFAVTQTNDPSGTWNRFSVVADPTSTAGGGHWIDYPSVGFNKNWIVVNENVFNYGTAVPPSFYGTQIYVLDKQAAYSNTLGAISLFEDPFTNCVAPFVSVLGCGFTMAPAITEDNTTDTEYLIEDWDNLAGQLRLTKITGTPSTPALTVGTQFPQSPLAWQYNAARILVNATTQSGGYLPQRQLAANLVSGTRIMANDSRIQNSVLRNGKLWATHTVMLAATPTAAGPGAVFDTTNPDTHSGVQWWQIDPTIEGGGTQLPLQRARIEDATADNCHNGVGGTNATAPRCTSTAGQTGEFYAFPNISVNQSGDALIGFTRFSAFTYPNSAYCIRRSADPVNTTRDPVVFRPGQANYNIGGGSGTARQNRWGDYSAAQTDPLNDIDFWAVQEYAGTQRNDFLAPSYAGPWETWWALISPSGTIPATSGSLIISQFRLRGPQGLRDEFVELYNPGATPVIVNTVDNSDGWALAFSTDGVVRTGVAVVPNGTVIPVHGHFLIANNPDNTPLGTSALTYSLNGSPSTQARTADSDTGWAFDLGDNGGLALFKTANTANFNAGTRLDSVGFSTIATGLFKEGNGIPAVTLTTPAGQMTFYRDLSSGTSKDTDVNENDFLFCDTVIESLGVQPRLGAAAPQNLNSPLHLTGATVPASLLDLLVGRGSAPNLFRDTTPGPAGTSTFGTITFRRIFTNNTGADLQRLRYRIVDITTNPAAGAAADLRSLTAPASTVILSDGSSVSVGGSTLESPPAQAVGGAFNSSLSAAAVSIATPFVAGTTTNLQFTLGVQVRGVYNFCLVAEGSPNAASAPLCFAGTTENVAPTITPGAPLAIATGATITGVTIATVSDVEDAAGTLTVAATSVPPGISVSSIVNTNGTVTATVSATCAAVNGANNVKLQVSDTQGATTNATFVVNVAGPIVPTITVPQSVPVGSTNNTASVVNHSGSTFAWTLTGGTITSGDGTSTIQYSAGAPGTRMSFSVIETNAGGCASAAGTKREMVDFLDVPPSHIFHTYVIKIALAGITGGCGGGNYCPDADVLRSQMAIFLLRGEHGETYAPPAAVGIFADVPTPSIFADFIEQLYNEGITGGCAANPLRYCPNNPVLRSQMAIFLLRAEHGSAYVPPTATGIFADVPVGSFGADFIERLYGEGITGGCAMNPLRYCPNDATTRGAMAVFLSRTFALP